MVLQGPMSNSDHDDCTDNLHCTRNKYSDLYSGVGVRLKVGGINIEKIEGVGSGEGLCRPQLGVWGLAPRKKPILR